MGGRRVKPPPACCHVTESPNMMTYGLARAINQIAETILRSGEPVLELWRWRELEEVAALDMDHRGPPARARGIMKRLLAAERAWLLSLTRSYAEPATDNESSQPGALPAEESK
jgi:hypothetical protein